jgi:tetratricopeptide (TPR) repeat protein
VADAYRLQNQLDLAVGAYDRALENPLPEGISPEVIYRVRAETNKILGNFDAALEDINRVLDANPDDSDLYSIRGLFYYETGDLPAALDDLNKSVQLDESDYYGYFGRMLVLGAMGRDAEALADFEQYINYQEVRRIPRPLLPANSKVTLEMSDGWIYYIPFDGQAGQHIDIGIERPVGSIADSVLVVLGPDGVPRAGNDDSGGDFDAAIVDFTLPADGRYTLLVTHAGGVTEGSLQVTFTVR